MFCAVIFQATILYRFMIAFAYVMEYYTRALIASHRKTYAIGMA